MQRIETLSVSNQKVFVRADLSGLGDPPSGKALSRILPVVEILLGKQAGVVLAGHDSNQNTFAPLADAIGKSLGRPVHLVEPGDMKQRWSTLKAGQVILLENLSKYDGETKGENAFAEQIGGGADLYVSDCFAALALPYASITKLTKNKTIAAGPGLHSILLSLQEINSQKNKPLVSFLGGNDFAKKVDFMPRMLRLSQTALIAGSIAYTFLKSRLVPVGNSIVDNGLEVTAFQLQEKAKLEQTQFILPVDHMIGERFSRDAKAKASRDLPDRWMGLDIGPKTIASFEKALKGAGSILWYGTAGAVELPAFQTGTKSLMKFASKLKAPITFLGEDTVRMADEFTFASATMIPGSESAIQVLLGKNPPGLALLQKEI